MLISFKIYCTFLITWVLINIFVINNFDNLRIYMNILLIGSGGREHALAYSLYHSNSTDKIYCSPGNPGIFQFCNKAEIKHDDFSEIANFCKSNNIYLVVVGPEQPLSEGISDFLEAENIKVFGPSKSAAQLESSKGFAKEFMKKYKIPTAEFKIFTINQMQEAIDYLNTYNTYPLVLKADGLAAGKGVVICENIQTAINELEEFFSGKFGTAGQTIVLEEFMNGEEASILALTDGDNFITLASSQDHKRAFDGDLGPNTGGMGAYSPAPIVTDEILEKVKDRIIRPTLEGMKNEGMAFKGCLYVGIMINNAEPKVVEYNVRFGDPETQAVLANFKGDFAGLLLSIAEGELDESFIDEVCDTHSCCVVMTSEGYPGNYPKGQIISGIKSAEKAGAIVFQAGTSMNDGELVANGGRVLGVTGIGNSLKQAVDNAYDAVNCIKFDNSFYRKDIAHKALKK